MNRLLYSNNRQNQMEIIDPRTVYSFNLQRKIIIKNMTNRILQILVTTAGGDI